MFWILSNFFIGICLVREAYSGNEFASFVKVLHIYIIDNVKWNALLKRQIAFCKQTPKKLANKSAQKVFQALSIAWRLFGSEIWKNGLLVVIRYFHTCYSKLTSGTRAERPGFEYWWNLIQTESVRILVKSNSDGVLGKDISTPSPVAGLKYVPDSSMARVMLLCMLFPKLSR